MMTSRNKRIFISIIFSIIIAFSMVFMIFRLLGNKNNFREQSRSLVFSSVKRARILNKDSEVICMDKLENLLLFNCSYFKKADDSEKARLAKVFSQNSDILNFNKYKRQIEESEDDMVVIESAISPERKYILKNAIQKNDLQNYLSLEENCKRVFADKNYPADVLKRIEKFIGSVEEGGARNGIRGVEKLFNDYLKYSANTDGKDVYLTLDLKMLKDIDDVCKKEPEGLHVTVFSLKNAELLAIYDNEDDLYKDRFYNELYSFPKMKDEFTENVMQVLGMIETDPSRLENYYCPEHSNVDIIHSIQCPEAIRNMLENYEVNEFKPFIENLNYMTEYDKVSTLFRLAFIAISPYNFIPSTTMLENSFLYKIGTEGESTPKNWPGFDNGDNKEVKISPMGKNFLKYVFLNNINPKVCAFDVKGEYLVVIYDRDRVNMHLVEALKNKLEFTI